MIPKGTEIICRGCDTAIYRLARNVNYGDPIEAEDMGDLGYGSPKPEDEMLCPKCGQPGIRPALEAL